VDRTRMYFNSFGARISSQDIMLLASLQEDVKPVNGPQDAQVEIFMSSVAAKQLMFLLQDIVNAYEKIYGKINIEPNMDVLKELQSNNPNFRFEKEGEPIE
jgi:DNA polymerase III sliding clamp (beta) subunit (PCNA family)